MGSVEINEVEKKVLANCSFLWSQNVANQSVKILEVCKTKEDVASFFKECENNIRNLYERCRIIWNGHTQSFGGDEFGYIVYFYSDILLRPIKVSMKIDTFEQVVIIGNLDIANSKEEKKLAKDLNITKPLNTQEECKKNG
ncbi:MAG: hypothetical protein AABX17_03035 [Nanoarchaeota archaeon]